MAVGPRTPVSALEGIGPATEEALREVRVFTVFDLLRGPEDVIHPAVARVASRGDVVAWRTMAALLQVAEVNPQWAEALHRAGVESVEDLASRSLTEAQEAFAAAFDRGAIPAAPSPDQVARMIADAAVIHSRGSLTGTVLDAAGGPVDDAEVRVGDRVTWTDARGRFRLIRIPLGRRPVATVTHQDHAPLLVEDPPISVDSDAIDLVTFRLPGGAPTDGGERLSEFDGDVLPPVSGHAVRLEELDPANPRPGDVFVVHEIDDRGAMLVSRFRSYQDGRFLVGRMRVPPDRLPPGLARGEHVRYEGGAFVQVAMDARLHDAFRAVRRMARTLGVGSRPQTLEELDDHLRERLSFLLDRR